MDVLKIIHPTVIRTKYYFDRSIFLKLLTYAFTLNIFWAFASTQIELLAEHDKGFITSTGFIILYPLGFFILLEGSKRTLYNWLMFTVSTAVIFLISTFIIPMLGIDSQSKVLQLLILLVVSTFSASLITFNVGRYFKIEFKKFTIIITSLFAFLVSGSFILLDLPNKIGDLDFNVLSPLSVGFATWQIFTSAAIAVGITLKRAS